MFGARAVGTVWAMVQAGNSADAHAAARRSLAARDADLADADRALAETLSGAHAIAVGSIGRLEAISAEIVQAPKAAQVANDETVKAPASCNFVETSALAPSRHPMARPCRRHMPSRRQAPRPLRRPVPRPR